jgi:hypothetical protein
MTPFSLKKRIARIIASDGRTASPVSTRAREDLEILIASENSTCETPKADRALLNATANRT